jgi:hypothetical protein
MGYTAKMPRRTCLLILDNYPANRVTRSTSKACSGSCTTFEAKTSILLFEHSVMANFRAPEVTYSRAMGLDLMVVLA